MSKPHQVSLFHRKYLPLANSATSCHSTSYLNYPTLLSRTDDLLRRIGACPTGKIFQILSPAMWFSECWGVYLTSIFRYNVTGTSTSLVLFESLIKVQLGVGSSLSSWIKIYYLENKWILSPALRSLNNPGLIDKGTVCSIFTRQSPQARKELTGRSPAAVLLFSYSIKSFRCRD